MGVVLGSGMGYFYFVVVLKFLGFLDFELGLEGAGEGMED